MTMTLRRGALAFVLFLCANASFASPTFILVIDGYCTGSKPSNILQWVSAEPPPYTVLRDGVAIATTNNYTYQDSTLPGALYKYVVTAKDASGVTTRSNETTVATFLCNRLPGRPVVTVSEICNLGVTPHRAGVHLSWTAATNADYYEVYNGGSLVQSLIYGLSADDLSPLTPGHTYNYYVAAVTWMNGRNGSDPVFITTSSSTACPPPPEAFTLSGSAVCDLNPAAPTPTAALTWTKSPNATSYQILRDGAPYTTVSATAFSDSNVATGHSYAYAIRAINNSGSIDSNAISVPVGATICNIPPGAFSLSSQAFCLFGDLPYAQLLWSMPKTANTVVIYRDGVPIRGPYPAAVTSLEDYEIAAGRTYSYAIRASNAYGTTEATSVVTTPGNLCFPAAPSSLLLVSYCDHNAPVVHLSWAPVQYATAYQVFRDGVPISVLLPKGAAAFDDHTASAGKSYKYVVTSSNRHGAVDSPASSVSIAGDVCPVAAHPFAVTARAICTTAPAVTIEWLPPANIAGYSIYRNAVYIGTVTGNGGTFTDTSVAAGQSYAYYVRGETAEAAYESNVVVVPVAVCPTVPPRHRSARH